MTKKKQTVNPYEVELLDLWNEVGGQMVIKYHIATIKPDKGDLQQLRDKGFKTDVMACIMSAFIGHGKSQEETLAFLEEAAAAGAAPSVTFEAAEGEALNITDKENNPMVNQLVEAIEKYIGLSQERKNQMSIESRKLAEMRFDVKDVIAVYDSIVSNTQ